jgi:hypothetical protein
MAYARRPESSGAKFQSPRGPRILRDPSMREYIRTMTTTLQSPLPDTKVATNHLARLVLLTFVVTFMTSRVLVILIMSRAMPDLFLHVGGTHVHHLNYGIFLLSGVGAYLIFKQPQGTPLDIASVIYGIGLALTFDEFGMWVHLGGSYWQRASYDAVVTIAAVLGLIAYAPNWKRATVKHKITGLILLGLLIGFAAMLVRSVELYGHDHGWRSLADLEAAGPA